MENVLADFGITEASVTDYFTSLMPGAGSALVVIFIGIVFYLVTSRLIEAGLRRTHMQPSLIKITVRSLYKWAVAIFTGIFMLSQLGVNVTAALAGVGVLGIAIGFAAQQTLTNIFSGFGIFIDHLYRTGDWVTIDSHYGEVVHISLRTTKIRTLDNVYITIPNSKITSSAVTNLSEKGMVRVTSKVSIGYGESIDNAREVLTKAARELEDVKEDPAPEVVVDDLDDSGVNLKVRVWIDNPRYEQKYFFLLTETCKKALDEAGITIPFPQRDVHMIEGKKRGKK